MRLLLISLLALACATFASDIKRLDDQCAYCVTDENPSLTYRQALQLILDNVDMPEDVKDRIKKGMGLFASPVADSIDFGPTSYLELEKDIKTLSQILAQEKPHSKLFKFKHSVEADKGLELHPESSLIECSVGYALTVISSNAWGYKKKQKDNGQWYDPINLNEDAEEN